MLTSRRSIIVGVLVAVAQTVALAVAPGVTGSAALKTQTATNLADVAVGVFLLFGVFRGQRPADEKHPLGYGREGFFWSFIAAIGILVGGVGAAMAETLHTALHPQPAGSYLVGYLVLLVVIGLDTIALIAGLRPLQARAAQRHLKLATLLWRGTDPAVTTLVLSSAAGVLGGVIAALGLAGRQLFDHPATDVAASALIGVVLLATSVVLLRTNRELLTGRGLPVAQIDEMRALVESRPGVLDVPDIFAMVVGPSTLIVDGDIIFRDELDMTDVESTIVAIAAALRSRSPAIAFVYLNPVSQQRSRGTPGAAQ